MKRTGKITLTAMMVVVGLGVSASPASAETDTVTGYLLETGGHIRGRVSDVYVTWKGGCGVDIVGTIWDRRADGNSVTYWRKFDGFPLDGGWKKLGKAVTSGWASPGPNFNHSTHFCDSAGVWLAFCYKDQKPTANQTTRLCSVDYRKDNTGRSGEKVDTTAPTLNKPIATLAGPYSRTVNYAIEASDNSGEVTQMRVRVGPTETEWRPWVSFAPNGTVILPDAYGEFTIWFQVKDAAGNRSSARAADNVTRSPDTTAPALGKPIATLGDATSRTVSYSLDASDDSGTVSQMRVRVGPVESEWRPWVSFAPNGTVILPDTYGEFTIWFQVGDAAGNLSFERAADNVTRTAAVSLALQQIDNSGNVRSCGSSETSPCSDVVKKFRATIYSARLPDVDLLVKAWRFVNGSWVETSQSPFMRMPITGHVMEFEFTANALAGVWRFQVQVPRDPEGATEFAASNYQYLRID